MLYKEYFIDIVEKIDEFKKENCIEKAGKFPCIGCQLAVNTSDGVGCHLNLAKGSIYNLIGWLPKKPKPQKNENVKYFGWAEIDEHGNKRIISNEERNK